MFLFSLFMFIYASVYLHINRIDVNIGRAGEKQTNIFGVLYTVAPPIESSDILIVCLYRGLSQMIVSYTTTSIVLLILLVL